MKSESSTKRFYVRIEDREHGPFELTEIRNLVNEGIASMHFPVREENSLETIEIKNLLDDPGVLDKKQKKPLFFPTALLFLFFLIALSINFISYSILDKRFDYFSENQKKFFMDSIKDFNNSINNEIQVSIPKRIEEIKLLNIKQQEELNRFEEELKKSLFTLEALSNSKEEFVKYLDELKKEGLNNKKMLEEKNNSINSTLDKNETQMVNFYSEFKKHKALRDDLDLRLKAMHTSVSDLEKRQRYTYAWLNDLSDEIRKLQ
jgi:hypothetical protein